MINKNIRIAYDKEMDELLKSENIKYATIENVLRSFIKEKFKDSKFLQINILIPFENPNNNKNYSLYGKLDYQNNHILFNLELLAISIKRINLKSPIHKQ